MCVCVTGLERGEATLQHVALLYARRADTETVFDELKNQCIRPADPSMRSEQGLADFAG